MCQGAHQGRGLLAATARVDAPVLLSLDSVLEGDPGNNPTITPIAA